MLDRRLDRAVDTLEVAHEEAAVEGDSMLPLRGRLAGLVPRLLVVGLIRQEFIEYSTSLAEDKVDWYRAESIHVPLLTQVSPDDVMVREHPPHVRRGLHLLLNRTSNGRALSGSLIALIVVLQITHL